MDRVDDISIPRPFRSPQHWLFERVCAPLLQQPDTLAILRSHDLLPSIVGELQFRNDTHAQALAQILSKSDIWTLMMTVMDAAFAANGGVALKASSDVVEEALAGSAGIFGRVRVDEIVRPPGTLLYLHLEGEHSFSSPRRTLFKGVFIRFGLTSLMSGQSVETDEDVKNLRKQVSMDVLGVRRSDIPNYANEAAFYNCFHWPVGSTATLQDALAEGDVRFAKSLRESTGGSTSVTTLMMLQAFVANRKTLMPDLRVVLHLLQSGRLTPMHPT